MNNENFLKELHAFMQSKGFVYGPFPELYGGVAGFYADGPLGKLLKNKVENSVRNLFFSNGLKDNELLKEIKKIKCPNCKGNFKEEIKRYSLMMKTEVAGKPFSLRPETATVTYLSFKRLNEYFRKLPFAVFQIGKAYRNEISPRQHLLRCREFTQAEAQLFIDPKEKNNWEKYELVKKEKLPLYTSHHQEKNFKLENISLEEAIKHKHIKTKAYAWCLFLAYKQFLSMGIPKDRIRIRQHLDDERAFYADDAWDIEINLNSFGWTETCGIHDRINYDLKKHSEFSKQDLVATRDDGRKFIPHILKK